jgi:hypothetical protein
MKSFDKAINTNALNLVSIRKRTAYHLSGQAIAIYQRNKQKKLPPVYFQIEIPPTGEGNALIEGGALIQNPLLLLSEVTHYFSKNQLVLYRNVIEADIINLLAGFIAEAKYLALYDDHMFTGNHINVDTLHYYGKRSDLTKINEYMNNYIVDEDKRNQKLQELVGVAIDFVNDHSNWRSIHKLAEYIYHENKSTVTCEEIILH